MDKDQVFKAAKLAEKFTNQVDVTSNFKSAVFQVVFSSLLGRKAKVPAQPKAIPNLTAGKKTSGESGDYGLSKLVDETGLTEEQLRDVFDFTNDGPRVIVPGVSNGSTAEKQKTLAIVHLTASYFFNGKDREDAEVLRKECEDLGIVDRGRNFSRNLASISQFIRPIGRRGSVAKEYKITTAGRIEGVKIIKRITGGRRSE